LKNYKQGCEEKYEELVYLAHFLKEIGYLDNSGKRTLVEVSDAMSGSLALLDYFLTKLENNAAREVAELEQRLVNSLTGTRLDDYNAGVTERLTKLEIILSKPQL